MSSTKLGHDCCGDRYRCDTTVQCECGCNLCYCMSCFESHCVGIVKQMFKRENQVIHYGIAKVDRRVVTEGSCDGCDKKFKRVFPDMPPQESAQFVGCTHLTVHAGYGESSFLDGVADLEICDDCMEKILDAFPFLRKTINERNEFGL